MSQIAATIGKPNAQYFNGPGTIGLTTDQIAGKAFSAVKEFWQKGEPGDHYGDVFIAGYSRGGAAAITVANMCNQWRYSIPGGGMNPDPIPVRGMFLLDPVSKDPLCPGDTIPTNVKRWEVLYRDQRIKEYSPALDPALYDSWYDKFLCTGFNTFKKYDPDRYARKFMENSITLRYATSRVNNASHGACGGLPWPERRKDAQSVVECAHRLNYWLSDPKYPFRVTVRNYSFAHGVKDEVTDADIDKLNADRAELQRINIEAENLWSAKYK